jgi:glycosyltransferase involved in cell wall biosynthesis
MRLLLLAPPHTRVAADAEEPGVSIALLAEGLAARGHDVTVASSGAAETAAATISLAAPRSSQFGDEGRMDRLYAVGALARARDVDLIHSFAGVSVAMLAHEAPAPVLTTLTAMPLEAERAAWTRARGAYSTQSWAQAALVRGWLPGASFVGAAYPPVDVDSLPFEPEDGGYLVALGPLGPASGVDLALVAARRAEMPIVLMGPVADGAAAWFDAAVRPHLDGQFASWETPADRGARRRLLARARGVLVTSRRPVAWVRDAAEAMAMGAPAVLLDRGPAREVVVHAESGFVAEDLAGLVSSIDRLDSIDRRACRRRALRCWDTGQIALLYEGMYAAVRGVAAMPMAAHPEIEALDPREPVAG